MKIAPSVDPGTLEPSFFQLLKHWTGLDRAIAFLVLARFWSGMAGIISVVLIARFLTLSEQGYYYTFSSLVALQVIFELGFSFVVLQLAAHERAKLTFLPGGRIEGDAVAHSRLASILQKSIRWYSVAAMLMAATLLPVGFYFFGAHQHSGAGVAWKGPWCLLVAAAVFTFQIDPIFAFIEGCGFVSQVAQMRVGQAVLGSTLAWLSLVLHHGLYAPGMVIVGQATAGLLFLLSSRFRPLLKNLLLYRTGGHQVGWRREIWPFQWKIAVSWLSGYAISQLFNPVLFAYQGAVAAGRMGMSLSIAGAIGALAISWMGSKQSPFGAMIARGEYASLDKLFFRTFWQAMLLFALGATTFLLLLPYCEYIFPKFAARVLSPWVFGLILMNTAAGTAMSSFAIYLRSHKQEPFLGISVMSAILLGTSTVLLARYASVNAVVVGQFVISTLFCVPVSVYIFITKRRQWHSVGS